MPKFFGSDSEEEQSEESFEEEVPSIKVPSRFAKGDESDESEEDTPKKRVVRSARDKAFEELRKATDTVHKDMKKGEHGDWNAISTDFEKLTKSLDKAKQIVQKEGIPNFFIRLLVQLEDFIKTVTASPTKGKMSKLNEKTFNTMKTKINKHNRLYADKIQEFRKNPPAVSDNEESEEEDEWNPDESDDEGGVFQQPTFEDEPPKKGKGKAIPESDEEDEESDEEESDEEDEESGSEEDSSFKVVSSSRNKWLKTDDKKKETKKPVDKEKSEKEKKVQTKTIAKSQDSLKSSTQSIPRPEERELDEKEIRSRLREILKERGKRNTDTRKQVERIQELLPHAQRKKFDVELEVLTQIIASQFDVNKNAKSIMPLDLWRNIYANLTKTLDILDANPTYALPEPDEPEVRLDTSIDTDVLADIGGNLMSFIERFDLELFKRFRNLKPGSPDYIARLGDENMSLTLAERTQAYYERHGKMKRAARMAYLRLEHYYHKLDPSAMEKLPFGDSAGSAPVTTTPSLKSSQMILQNVDSKALVEKLTQLIYQEGDSRLKTRAMLCHIFYHALHDRFYLARDMMLMSRLQESIANTTEKETMVLFNRAMVQLGLAAFRNGLIKQAHSCLSEIYTGGHFKELLAQGITNIRQQDRDKKVVTVETLPQHMHINSDVMEAVHLISALLLEVPNMAANQFDPRKKGTFRRLLEVYEKNVLNGPPETTRDYVWNAAKALSVGDWKRCEELLLNLNIWNLIHNADAVKAMLQSKIKEEGLRTYIFTFSKHYDALSLEQLSSMFELPKNIIHSIISKMIHSEELRASWDQPTGSIIIHHVDPSRLQYLASQFSDKVSQFVEGNDKLNAPPSTKTGGTIKTYQKRQGQGRGDQKRQQPGNAPRAGRRDNRGGSTEGDNRSFQQPRTGNKSFARKKNQTNQS